MHHTRLRFTRQTQNISTTFVQRRPNDFDVGLTLYKCYTIFLCLLEDMSGLNLHEIEARQRYILLNYLYSAPRNKLLNSIRDIIAPGVQNSSELPQLDLLDIINIVLKGSNDITVDENVKTLHYYILRVGAFRDSST